MAGAGAGRDGAGGAPDGAAACGRKLAVDRGGALGGAGGVLLLTGAFDVGRAVGAAGGLRPGVLLRPALPPLATARAAALSAGLPEAGRAGEEAPVAGLAGAEAGRGASAAGRIGAAAGRLAAGRIGLELVGGETAGRAGPLGPEPAGRPELAGRAGAAGAAEADAGRTGGRVAPDEAGELDDDEPEGAVLAADEGPAEAEAALLGRPGTERTLVVASSLPAALSPGSLDFTSASVVIGVAPPPGICRDVLFGR